MSKNCQGNFKISTHPCYIIDFHGDEAKRKRKNQNGWLKKTEIFKTANSHKCVEKIFAKKSLGFGELKISVFLVGHLILFSEKKICFIPMKISQHL